MPYVGTGLLDSAALFRRASPEVSVGVATADLDHLAARLVEVAARRAGILLDQGDDVRGGGFVGGVGAEVRVERVELVGRHELRRSEISNGFGGSAVSVGSGGAAVDEPGAAVGAARVGGRGGVGRAPGEQCDGCRGEEREAGGTGA